MRITRDELPSRDQLEGTLERHARLVESTYGGMYPSLSTVDVLVLDSIQNIHPTVFLSMESVARRLRGKPNLPFGGLRVYGAADFWRLPVHPTSDTGGYLFQLDQWSEWFPKQQLLRKTFGQEKTLNEMTEKALFGTLTLDDMIEMERRSFEGKPEASLFSYSTSLARKTATTNTADTDDVKSWFTHGKEKRADTPLISLLNDDMVSNVTAISKYTPRFPKQPTVRVMPTRFKALKQVEVGNYLVNVIIQSSLPVSFGLVNSLSVDVGDHVHLILNSDQNAFGIAAGSVGEVMKIEEHFLTVHFIEEQKTVELPRMRVVTYHRKYPEVMYEVQQFPVFPRSDCRPLNIVNYRNCYKVNINCRRVADTNDLGNMLANYAHI
ncbi:hypothetical protein AGDE_05818 [Angomonas deanei]|uniref:Uncharacterized protein n=1 Tax=Angomonas deanei TaxID=59799 RepID=A0A7G2CCK9_9TRYP|nr:hypothetical protein AGDE_05818 [Angomonas deanei]CAD2215832.1 hypothetical protein, conserved [Angomonas deanei]|eukprot:EPY38113.1 hypothetical protein AGDE_05818 [Angomonas deanei]